MTERVGVILMNLGTPEAPTRSAVRRYLLEFLSDPLVIVAPTLMRFLIAAWVALFRSRRSAAAYASIWTDQGSPLLVHANTHANALAECSEGTYSVRLAMRYSSPDVASALKELRDEGCSSFVVMPMYPQYARATTLSSLRHIQAIAQKQGVSLSDWRWVPPFYSHHAYIRAYTALLEPLLDSFGADCVLMSFHGLPVKQLDAPVCSVSPCDRVDTPCPSVAAPNSRCYRAQCFATSRALAQALRLNKTQYAIGFQSRLGKLPWIGPDSLDVINELYASGVRRLAVISPAFVADCLETEEELGLLMRECWSAKENTSFTLLPCLNASPEWINATQELLQTAIPLTLSDQGELL